MTPSVHAEGGAGGRHRLRYEDLPAWIQATAPVLSVRRYLAKKGQGWAVHLATIPRITCLLTQPWAEHLIPGKDWLTVAGLVASSMPATPQERILLVRCNAAISRDTHARVTWHLSGTVDEVALSADLSAVLLSYPTRPRGRAQLDCRAPRETALRAASCRGTVRVSGTISVNPNEVTYEIQEVHA